MHRGETFGLVGESGCGKTTIGWLITALERPTAGTIRFEGDDISKLKESKALRRRRRDLPQLMFQDPYASLDPRMRVGAAIREPLVVQQIGSSSERNTRVGELLDEVGLSPRAADLYPHEFSGGQRQRIGIARAIVLEPKLIVADEPVSALDVSIQALILNLMRKLQDDHGLTYIVISHDLAVVKYLADTIAVMYLGKLVEVGPAEAIYSSTVHPYTKGLIDTIPVPDPAIALHPQRRRRQGRAALRDHAAVGLPFPHSLPVREGDLRRGGAAAPALRPQPPGRVPLRAAGAGARNGPGRRRGGVGGDRLAPLQADLEGVAERVPDEVERDDDEHDRGR